MNILQGFCEFGKSNDLGLTTEKTLAKFLTLGYEKVSETLPLAR